MVAIRFEPGLVQDSVVKISKEITEASSLSVEALGLLCYLTHYAETGHFEPEDLRAAINLGRDKYNRLMRELLTSGWVIRHQPRDHSTKTFGAIELHVCRTLKAKGEA
ncbi:hypothetical protein [Cohaesibacter haloalkalitolerans]|uniref:hypothetical protein n=1 Tax=Cohaesibacter haloalkalitolerans TaxID=1162980 RepID=UPI000E656FE0|nr:hypothetical protein [Cohaesibacter haloalkalitolerans]